MRWKRSGKGNSSLKVHVVGGGLAGLYAAYRLHQHGAQVTLYEASPHLGGRCRSFDDATLGCTIDNGNHLILRANRTAWKLIGELHQFKSFYAPASDYLFCDLPAKRYRQSKPPLLPQLHQGWRLTFASSAQKVASCFSHRDATSLYYRFITPFCLAALNTHPNAASAAMLRRLLLRLTLPGAADYLQIRTDFDSALIQPMAATLPQIHRECRLKALHAQGERITRLEFTDRTISLSHNDRVILALPAAATRGLLPQLALPEISHHAIINGHFRCDTDALAPRLLGTTGSDLHWAFIKDGLISTTTSHAESTALWEHPNKAAYLWQELQKLYPPLAGMALPPHRILTEKRAALACTPDNLAKRPIAATPYRNLTLAGDWLDSPIPACIENSLHSGKKAVAWCLASAAQSAT